MAGPLICEVTRGTMVESVHRVHLMVMDDAGETTVWGDPDLMFYPRSAIKYLQALPLIESGAADACHASAPELALSAASHSGAPDHVAAVSAWLERLGLGESDLGCGAHAPYDEEAWYDMIRAGQSPTRINNNCSGKHTGFLATAQHLGEPTAGYLDAAHPVQKRLYDLLTEFGGEDLAETGRGIDGCGIPVYGMTLRALVTAARKLARPTGIAEERGRAIRRVLDAAAAHPYMVAGRGRFDTDVMTALRGKAVTKGGAEGVHLAVLPEKGIGVALKVEDGNKRAGDVAMAWLFERTGLFDDAARASIRAHIAPELTNAAGDVVGTIRVQGS